MKFSFGNVKGGIVMVEMKNEELKKFILTASKNELLTTLEHVHPADILDVIDNEEEDYYYIIKSLPEDIIAGIIDEAEDEEKIEILRKFPEDKQRKILMEMSSDEVADLIGNLDKDEIDDILAKLSSEDAKDIRKLLSYGPDTAGGIMATEYIAVNQDISVKQALKYLQKVAPDAETAYYIYVIDSKEVLKGIISLRDLVVSPFDTSINEIMNTNVTTVPYSMDQEEVAHIFEKYGFLTIPVVDSINRILGIVTIDDIVDVLRDETTEDIHRLGGVGESEKIDGNVLSSIKSRLPWLLVNLITAIIASSVVGVFQGTIEKVVILATFMPIVSGMGGNAGTQTLTIIVRGIALGELTFENSKSILIKEIFTGIINGAAIGLVIGIISSIWSGNPMLGVVMGVAMILNMVAAAIAGFMVPVVLKKLKIDPALASAVFVTTVTDVLGFFFFLGLASMFINYLV